MLAAQMSGGGDSDTNARDLLERVLRAFEERDWERLLGLYHPDALLSGYECGAEPDFVFAFLNASTGGTVGFPRTAD